ncbi:hypothetical protein D3C75_930820 [compost metagenome]
MGCIGYSQILPQPGRQLKTAAPHAKRLENMLLHILGKRNAGHPLHDIPLQIKGIVIVPVSFTGLPDNRRHIFLDELLVGNLLC